MRRPWLAALAACIAAAIVGCGGSSSPSGGTSSGGGGGSSAEGATIGYSTTFLADPFQALEQSNSQQQAKEQGLNMLQPTNAGGDIAQQANDIRNLITQGAKGLVLSVQDPKGIIPALDFAQQRGVKVVTIGTGVAGGHVVISVRGDNVGMGASACEAMGERLHGRGTVLSLQGALSSVEGRERTAGFRDCMERSFPGIKLIERPTDWDAKKAADQAQTIMSATPDLAGIYLQSDSTMLQAVSQVMKKAGKLNKVGEPGHVTLVTIDGTKLAHDDIRAGVVDATVSQPLDKFAQYSVSYLKDALAGKMPAVGATDHGSRIVEVDGNLQDQLPCPLVTSKNVDDPSLWGNQKAVVAGG